MKTSKYKIEYMRFITFTVLFFLYGATLYTQNNIEKSNVGFKIKNVGFYTTGTFSDSNFTGNFDLDDLKNSSVTVIIQVKSIDTGITKRDKHLLEADYFDVTNYPVIEFKSTKIVRKSETRYILYGKLTIKKKTKEVQLPLTVNAKGNLISISSDFRLSRKEYGVGGKSWVLSDKVKTHVQFTAKKL